VAAVGLVGLATGIPPAAVVTGPASAATTLTVAPAFAAYAPPGSQSSNATPTTFELNGLVSGGNGTIGSVTVTATPASGTAQITSSGSGSSTVYSLLYTPASGTSGTQTVGITVCDTASPADCGTGTVTLAPPVLTTMVFNCPSPLSGTGSQVVGVALQAPATVSPGATFTSQQAAEPTAVPSSQTCNGTTANVNSLSMVSTIVPVPTGASYVTGTASLIGGDPTTAANTALLYCTGSSTPGSSVPSSTTDTCTAQSGTSTYPPGTSASSWQTTTPYFELVTTGSYSPGDVITEPTVVAQFTASTTTGTTISPALTQFASTVSATAYGFTQTSTVYGAPQNMTSLGSTTVASPPGQPTITSVTPGDQQLTVTFDAPTATGGSPISSYQVACAPPSGAPTTVSDTDVTASPLSATVTGLVNGTSYACTVAATNKAGTGTASAAVSGTPAAAPPTVTAVSPTSGPVTGGTVVTVSGTGFTGATAVDFGSTAASSFTVDSSTSLTATSPATTTTGPVDIVVTTPSGTSAKTTADQFTYVIASTGGTGTSSGGSTGSGSTGSGGSTGGTGTSSGGSTGSPPGTEPTPPAPIPVQMLPASPAAPTDVRVAGADSALVVRWDPPPGSARLTAYLIGVRPTCAACQGVIVPGDLTTATVTGVPNGETASVVVVAVSSSGVLGVPSVPVSAVPNADAGCPGTSPGLWLVDWDGAITPDAGGPLPDYGSMLGGDLTGAVVSLVPAAGCAGYWEASANGGVFAFGGAQFAGSEPATSASDPVVGMAATADGRGYWLARADGSVEPFGDANRLSPSGTALAADAGRVVAIVADPVGPGYWLVTAAGDVAGFGAATTAGSLLADRLVPPAPVVAMAATPDGRGYWLLAADGAVYAFGDAVYAGGPNVREPAERWTAIVAAPDGGYWAVDAAGTVIAYGGAPAVPSRGPTGSITWAATGA